jgi:hypothetical protein
MSTRKGLQSNNEELQGVVEESETGKEMISKNSRYAILIVA